jgi:hypothetical protein
MKYEELDIIYTSEGCAEDAEIPAEVFEELEEDNDL